MKELHHPCVVSLRHSFFSSGDKADEVYLNLVMDFIPENAYQVLKHYNKLKQPMPILLIKLYAFQMFRALAYLQAIGICHRDIKPQNVLIDSKSQILKVCDFGSAKKLIKGEPNVSYICSRYYRAPELIFGNSDYSTMIDVWSTGCVIGEFMLGRPLFPGESGADQLVEIIKILGTPNKEQILSMNPKYNEFNFPQIKPIPWSKVFRQKLPADAIDFISKVLIFSPSQRLTPIQALLHPFFDQLREEGTLLPNGDPLHKFMGFTKGYFYYDLLLRYRGVVNSKQKTNCRVNSGME